MGKRNALGKGIASLLKTPENAHSENLELDKKVNEKLNLPEKKEKTSGVMLLPVDQLDVNKFQPRKIFKEKDLEDLANSIKENGILQPLLVFQKEDKTFELIAGERRLRAAKRVGLEYVPVIQKKVTEREKLVFAIIENIQRADLNCIEEALAYFQLMEDFGLNQENLAKKVGKERSTVANFLRLLKLPRKVVDLLQKDKLSMGHGKILVAIEDRDFIEKAAKEAVENNFSVRELESFLAQSNKAKKPKSAVKANPYEDVVQELEKKSGFQVQIKASKKGKGKITIPFYSEEEFHNLYDKLVD